MDAESYLVEHIMRVRMAEIQARAELARLLREANEHPRQDGIARQLTETGRALVMTARKIAFAISRALSNGMHVAKHR